MPAMLQGRSLIGLNGRVRGGVMPRSSIVLRAAAAPAVSVVPGTEILPPVPPTPLPAPTQGMDLVLQQIQAKEAAMQQAKAAVSARKVPGVEVPKLEVPKLEVPKLEVPKLEAPKLDLEMPKLDASSSLEAVTDLKDGAAAAASEAASQASAAAAGAASAVSSAVGDSVQQAAAGLSSAKAEVASQVEGTRAAAEALLQSAQSQATAALTDAQTAALGAASNVANAVGANVGAVVDTLPPPVKSALEAAAAVVADATHFLGSDSRLTAAAIGTAVVVPAVANYAANFAGYAGPYSAVKALEVLKTEDAVLVDVRTELQRIEAGVPELKRGALLKGTALPLEKLLPSVARRVRNPDALAMEILGAQVANLARLGDNTRIIIMDNRGESAKAVARAASAAGLRRAHIVSGGFAAWRSAGLEVVEKSDYDANPLVIVSDAAEEIVEEATAVLSTPQGVAVVFGGLTLAVVAAVNYHFTFRFLGVLGLEASLALRVVQWQSPQDALDDVRALFDTVANVVTLPLQLAGKASIGPPPQRSQQ